jgi:outer membrane protein OmpA-like peptidoglycan-associated protein
MKIDRDGAASGRSARGVRGSACAGVIALIAAACSGAASTGSAAPERATGAGDEHEAGSARAHRGDEAAPCADWQVHFEPGSAELDPAARQKLIGLAECIRSGAIDQIRIVGSTDPRGTEEQNIVLGRDRASAVRAHLISLGCEPDAIRLASIGEADASESPDEWREDRRASVRTEDDADAAR